MGKEWKGSSVGVPSVNIDFKASRISIYLHRPHDCILAAVISVSIVCQGQVAAKRIWLAKTTTLWDHEILHRLLASAKDDLRAIFPVTN